MTKGSGAKKVNAKKVAKAVEDKTFGMKNKGGKKNQAVVKQMSSTLSGNQRKAASSAKQPPSKKAVKAERDEELARLGLFKTVPKKAGAATASSSNATEVVEHEEVTEGMMLEDMIEDMRRKLPPNLTKVTPESFAIWYAKKKKEKAEKRAKKASKREKDIALGKVSMTGRELFDRKRNVFVDDERADEEKYDIDETAAVFVASLEEQMRMDAEVNGVEFDEQHFHVERDKVLQRIKDERAAAKASGGAIKMSASVKPTASIQPSSSSAPSDINVDSLAAAPPIDESLFNEDDIPDDFDDDEDGEEDEEGGDEE